MRFYYDTEFLEDGRTIDFLSIGVVSEDDQEYYAVNGEFSGAAWLKLLANPWMVKNVLPFIPTVEGVMGPVIDRDHEHVKPLHTIKSDLLNFMGYKHHATDGKTPPRPQDIELWADFAAYDHIVFCQLWGKMMDLPTGMPMYTNDIQQAYRSFNAAAFIPPERKMQPPVCDLEDQHHALADARHVKTAYDHLARVTRQI